MAKLVYPWTTDNGELASKDDAATTADTRGLIAAGVDAGGVARFLQVDSQGRVVLASGGGANVQHWESTWFAGVETVTEGLTQQIGARTFPASLFPATSGALSRVVRLHVVAQVSAGVGPIQAELVDITLGSPTAITNATLTTSSTSPVELVSAAPIPVADVAGSLFLTGNHLYELNITTPLGGGTVATITNAWLSVDYE